MLYYNGLCIVRDNLSDLICKNLKLLEKGLFGSFYETINPASPVYHQIWEIKPRKKKHHSWSPSTRTTLNNASFPA